MAGWVKGDVATGGAATVDLEKTGGTTEGRQGSVELLMFTARPPAHLEVDPSSNPKYVYK